MKITIVTRNMCAGGAERVISQLLSEWVKNNTKCHLILLENTEDFYEIPAGVCVTRIGGLSNNSIINKIKSYYKVRQLIKNDRPNVVLSLPEEIGIYVIGSMLFSKIPVVVSERNNPRVMPYKKTTRFLRNLLYPFASGFIFQSKEAAEFFSDKIQKKGIILPNPLDLSRIPDEYMGELNKVVVAAGRFEEQKNFKLLIDAFAEFYQRHKEYKLIIYGDGSKRKELVEYANSIIGEAGFEFPGRNNDLLRCMQQNEIFVLCSDYEGSPNVLIEAMACGMSVISTDFAPGGVDKLIESHKNGIIIPKGDKEELLNSLEELAIDKNLQGKFRKNAKKIQNRFDSTVVSKQWKDYLMKVGD